MSFSPEILQAGAVKGLMLTAGLEGVDLLVLHQQRSVKSKIFTLPLSLHRVSRGTGGQKLRHCRTVSRTNHSRGWRSEREGE